MGLGGFLGKILDPGGLVGGLSGKTGAAAAEEASRIEREEILRQFEQGQANLKPFLEAAQRQIPGIERQLTPGGFESFLGDIRPELQGFLAPIEARKAATAQTQLGRAGLNVPGAVTEAAQIDPVLFNDLLLGAEADLFTNRFTLSGLGEGAGGVLSELGQRTGSAVAQSEQLANQLAQQSKAAGQQNILGLAGLAAGFFSDENLKDDIETIGSFKGLDIIKWTWKSFVPESWKDITIGFSAQNVLQLYPQFVHEKNGFLAIDRPGLMEHLNGD